MNGNTNGLGMIARNSDGELLKLSTGVIPNLTPLQNQLWAILHGLIRAFEDNHRDIVVETDNWQAFNVLKNFPYDVPEEAVEVAVKIFIRLHDPRWICSIVYVFPERNKLSTYLSRLEGDKCNQLYTFSRPIGCVEELMSLDLGFGPLAPQFQDVEIYNDEPVPADFGPTHVGGITHSGYAFHEDFIAIDNEMMEAPKVVNVHNVMAEDFIFGNGYAYGFVGDHPMNIMH